MAGVNFTVLGVEECAAFFKELGKVPQKTVKKAARAGAVMVRKKILSSGHLPVKDGHLRDSIIVMERKNGKKRNRSGKAEFDVANNPDLNFVFQKKIKEVGKYGGTSQTGYYPASMEYGFKSAKGFVPGHHYMRDTAEAEESAVQNKMLEVISKDIDALQRGMK
ncbi:HK97 gp10 family phage protein [Paenibacillus sp. OV219]|uniref:HK97 gp10 family phage protein n=1 Tax=Paenibacillus sp. OV219 TaxID=1884377 RepID=UPI0008CCBC28|nr:HK97 gp10 family phage protein [Paenibacillus sp. OV219]SEN19132.1 Bacteriophage HK97-gp10, putative tail-component [Paenibacillus sp. OV219]